LQFISAVLESQFVAAVNDPDQAVGLLEIVPPIGSDGGLAANIPHIQFATLMFDCFDLETEGGRDL
jgi:hypothetical protein